MVSDTIGRMGGRHKRTDTPIEGVLVAERVLKRFDNNEPLHVRVWSPVPAPDMRHDSKMCCFEIMGLDEPFESQTVGADSLQALNLVIAGIRKALKESGLPIGLMGDTPGHTGFERFHSHPMMESLFENIWELEIIRQNLLFRTLSPHLRPQLTARLEDTAEPLEEIERLRHLIRAKILGSDAEAIAGLLSSVGAPQRVRTPQAEVFVACIAERTFLTRHDTGGAIQIEVWKPVPAPTGKHGRWTCGYRITGLDEQIECATEGHDSMEALKLVFEAIRLDLKESELPLGFPDSDAPPGFTGLERFHHEPDMEELAEHLIEVEVTRQKLLRQSLDAITSSSPTDLRALLYHTQRVELLRQRILNRIMGRKRTTTIP